MRLSRFILAAGWLFDLAITIAGLFLHRGLEGNPLISWIQPPALFAFVTLGYTMIMLPAMFMLQDRYPEKYKEWFDVAFIIVGLWHIVAGLSWTIWA